MSAWIEARIEEKLRRAETKNIPEALGFLDPAQQAEAQQILRKIPGARTFFSGGFPGAERKFLFFLPEYFEEEQFPVSDYIAAFSAQVPFGTPSHRDFLGALLGLGITRESVGDILVSDAQSVILVAAKLAPFVREQLQKVGRQGVTLRDLPLDEIHPEKEPYDEVEATVASLRLDAVLAAAFHVSRSVAAEAIASGLVARNWLTLQNPAAELAEGDLISWRGRGRARLAACGGVSKKGRQFISAHVYAKKR